MVTKEQIERINELYKKSKEIGLTDEEKKEQEELRRLYVKAVRENLKSQLQNIKIVSPEEYEKLTNTKKCGCGHDHFHKDDSCNCKEHRH
ncbi:hypothetical protein Q428_03670 [Fervidicella metallireducens AeB]|uniref:UPF0291 protein Q428_03670 n=1 Tax=Fervidicella metallireducens AeB TaxID=1403537 RepID=A0A017RWQ2_9CLOT|nr:DUF896 domain-containing protein [Fervidicella metallireducens]EYE89203.1 hypothetical protein Q428_03670 [Fervidicella metallireducens AeB]